MAPRFWLQKKIPNVFWDFGQGGEQMLTPKSTGELWPRVLVFGSRSVGICGGPGSLFETWPWKGWYVNPHHFCGSHTPKNDGYMLQKGVNPFSSFTFSKPESFWKNIPWVSIEVWPKKTLASGPQMHQNVVRWFPLRQNPPSSFLSETSRPSWESKGRPRPWMPPFPTPRK